VDTKAYIESGVIESYVLGLASAAEVAELELLCMQHADIKNAVDEFAALMEVNAFNNAVTPPSVVKDKVMLALSNEFENEKNIVPVIPMHTADAEMQALPAAPKTIWRYLAAASIILLVASTALNFYFYSSYKESTEKYVALLEERNSLQTSNDVYRTNMNIIQDTNVQKIDLKTVKPDQNNLAAIFWNKKTSEVYLMPASMAALPADKQYELWAIVDGTPVNAGVLENCDKESLCKMLNISKAQAFAITIENKGSSKSTPNLPGMVVAGEVKI
jgi:anti-sigma-K factor RskA